MFFLLKNQGVKDFKIAAGRFTLDSTYLIQWHRMLKLTQQIGQTATRSNRAAPVEYDRCDRDGSVEEQS